MGSKYLTRYLILMITLIIGAGSSLGQLTNSNYDYLGTPVYYSSTQHLPGMPMSQPVYNTPYLSSYYTNQVNYTGGDWLGTPVYYSNTQHLPGTPLGQPAYVAPYVTNYYVPGAVGPSYYGLYPYGTGYTGPSLTGFGMTGRVVDQYGNGIPGAQVVLTNIYDVGTFTTTTNSLGSFGINAPNGVYYVSASMPGYSFSQSVGRITAGIVSPALIIVGNQVPGATAYGAQAAGSYGAQAAGSYGSQTAGQPTAYGAQSSTTPAVTYGTQTTTPAVTYAT
jgi:hypothetical protein